ncbi:MAG: MFS transporter [Ilumatobacter sp.]|uniref:MFS transporter n=1 Tax=Ilumatobacter sp. TaxID=1967498 RepID=UPI0039190AEC
MLGRLTPEAATPDATVLLQTRAVRAFGDGLVSVVLAAYLTMVGLSATEIGIVIAATLLGSAALTLYVGLRANTYRRQRLLRLMSLLMVATGIGFAVFVDFWPLALVGLIGTLNPSGGDVSAFLPTEQAVLPSTVPDSQRTALFARYGLVGILIAALGAGLAGIPEAAAGPLGISEATALRSVFVVYAVLGGIVFFRYRRLSNNIERSDGAPPTALGPSRRTVYRLAALFSLDSFGGGFTITAILVLWLQLRFELSLALTGAVFFWAGLLAAGSQLLAPRIARRIGLIRTMAFTHLPANAFLISAAFVPTAALAVGCLLARAALSQMDVPARSSYVMAVVTPDERPAAASITSVPRSLAATLPPIAAGWMLSQTSFGWPLIAGGIIKIIYDLLLLAQFRHLRPPEEAPASPTTDSGAP